LDRSVARRIVDRLERASTKPDHYFEKLVGSAERKLRMGDYRLLVALSPAEQVITVERVDHRRRVYQR
jgi:mRNA-degrading endonuclease RelE of RelBE toxin-antitoxin system